MTALEVLSDQLDAAARREVGHLHELSGLRSEVARLERLAESRDRLIAELRDLVELLGGERHAG